MTITKEWVDNLINARLFWEQTCEDIVFSEFTDNELLIYSNKNLKQISNVLEIPIHFVEDEDLEDDDDEYKIIGKNVVEYRGVKFICFVRRTVKCSRM